VSVCVRERVIILCVCVCVCVCVIILCAPDNLGDALAPNARSTMEERGVLVDAGLH
jgi:hypothetical protein